MTPKFNEGLCVPLGTLLEDLHRSSFEMPPGDYKLTVRRQHVFRDALIAFQTGFNFKKPISMTFIGEPAVDAGGPC